MIIFNYGMKMFFLQSLNHLGNRSRVLWMLQDPVVHEKLSPERAAITNDQIDIYNKAAMEVRNLF